jgi:hypothetical protein
MYTIDPLSLSPAFTAWRCPRCLVVLTLAPNMRGEDHVCGIASGTRPKTAWYFDRLRDDNFIYEFCVANSGDPRQYVDSRAPDGSMQRWRKREEGDLVIFTAPDGYVGGPIGWAYDRHLQIGEMMPLEERGKLALRNRVSA